MSTTFQNDYVTPPSTPRRLLNHDAYFPPRSHLVGLGLDFEFPTQSSIDGPEQCSAPRLGTFSSPYLGSNVGEERCASYWSADSSVSTASRRLRRLRSESEIEEDEDDNGNSLASSRSTPSNFAYSPFAGGMSSSPRLAGAFSAEALGLGLSIHDNDEEDQVAPQILADNENDAWSRQSAWSFECLESPGLPYEEEERRNGDNFGFKPAPSYSYALAHTTFALLPSAHIPTKSIIPSSSSTSPSIIPALSSSLLPLSDDLLQSSKVEKATGDDPFSANYNAKDGGERKRKRKESSIVGSPSTSSNVREESEHVKRLKSSPALKHLGIFTHAALLEEREQAEKQLHFADALSGLCVEQQEEESASHLLQAPQLPLVLEPTPELGSPSPSPSMRTVDCTLLVSSMPSESPYPPTPGSSAFAPFSYSSTIDSLASPSSSTFQEAVRRTSATSSA